MELSSKEVNLFLLEINWTKRKLSDTLGLNYSLMCNVINGHYKRDDIKQLLLNFMEDWRLEHSEKGDVEVCDAE